MADTCRFKSFLFSEVLEIFLINMKGKNKYKEKLYSEDFPLVEDRIDLLFFSVTLAKTSA